MFTSITAATHDEVLHGTRGLILHDTFVIEVRRGRDAPVGRHALHHVIAWTPGPAGVTTEDDTTRLRQSVVRVARELTVHRDHDMALLIHDTPDGATGPALAAVVRAWSAGAPLPETADACANALARLLATPATRPADGPTVFAGDREHDAAMTLAEHLRDHFTPTRWPSRVRRWLGL